MPDAQIIDLDALVGPPKKVRLAGEIYKLPADLPAALFLKISAYADSELSEVEMAEDLYEELLELFRVHQPDVESLPIGIAQMVLAIPQIYQGETATSAEEGGARPSRAGTRSTSRTKRTKKSASSTS